MCFFFFFFLYVFLFIYFFFFFKQKTAYEIYQCDWSSDVCSSDLVALIPTFPNVKDITDYVMRGGNLHELLQNAIHRENIREDMEKRKAQWQDYYFHEKFLEEQETVRHSFVPIQNDEDRTDIENARVYPISNLLKFIHNKTRCIWHEEKTASLTYYPKTNTVYCFGCGKHGDAIDVYRTQTGRSFLEALDNLH